jgi:hypothetical protein
VHVRLYGPRSIKGLTEAGEPLVGANEDEENVGKLPEAQCVHLGDLHAVEPPCISETSMVCAGAPSEPATLGGRHVEK